MKFIGRLVLKENSVDYGIYDGSSFRNLSEYLRERLMEKVSIHIKLDDYTLFKHTGELLLEKVSGNLYNFTIEEGKYEYNLDTVLWNLVDNKVEIRIIDEDVSKNVGNNESEEIK